MKGFSHDNMQRMEGDHPKEQQEAAPHNSGTIVPEYV